MTLTPRQKLVGAAVAALAVPVLAALSGGSATGAARVVLGSAALLGLVAWCWRARGSTIGGFRAAPRLKVVQRVGLSGRSALALVEIDGRPWLVAHGDGFARLRPVARPRRVGAVGAEAPAGASAPGLHFATEPRARRGAGPTPPRARRETEHPRPPAAAETTPRAGHEAATRRPAAPGPDELPSWRRDGTTAERAPRTSRTASAVFAASVALPRVHDPAPTLALHREAPRQASASALVDDPRPSTRATRSPVPLTHLRLQDPLEDCYVASLVPPRTVPPERPSAPVLSLRPAVQP